MAIVQCELGGCHSACDRCQSVLGETIFVEPPYAYRMAGTYKQVILCTDCYAELFPFARLTTTQETTTHEH